MCLDPVVVEFLLSFSAGSCLVVLSRPVHAMLAIDVIFDGIACHSTDGPVEVAVASEAVSPELVLDSFPVVSTQFHGAGALEALRQLGYGVVFAAAHEEVAVTGAELKSVEP